MSTRSSGTLIRLAILLLGVSLPLAAQAPADTVFGSAELDALPTFASQEKTARLLAESYPATMRRLGITGMVQVQFVVSAKGAVEAESIKVMSASTPQLATAATRVVRSIEFTPGLVEGRPVRALVLLPIVYK